MTPLVDVVDQGRRVPILQTPGVQQVVGSSLGPTPIEESEISGLQKAVAQGLSARPWPFLRCGDRVRIGYGSMAGVEGILLYEKGSHLLVNSIEVPQRSVAIEIGRDWVRPLNTTLISATA